MLGCSVCPLNHEHSSPQRVFCSARVRFTLLVVFNMFDSKTASGSGGSKKGRERGSQTREFNSIVRSGLRCRRWRPLNFENCSKQRVFLMLLLFASTTFLNTVSCLSWNWYDCMCSHLTAKCGCVEGGGVRMAPHPLTFFCFELFD